MSKCDRAESSQREDEVREAPIAHIEEAAVPNAWDAARQETHQMADRVGVMLDEPPAKGQGMVATTRSTAARTRSRVVTDDTKWSVISLSLRSTSTAVTP